MRILLVSPFFPPHDTVASHRVHAFAQAWARRGASVMVLTTAKRAEHTGLDLPRDGFKVVEVGYRVPGPLERLRSGSKPDANSEAKPEAKPEASPAASPDGEDAAAREGALARFRRTAGVFGGLRMPDLTDFWVRPALAAAREAAQSEGVWDAVVSSSGPYTAHLVAMGVKRGGLARAFVADYRDLWTENHMAQGLPLVRWHETRLERRVLAAADLVTTVTTRFAERLRARTTAPVEVIHNGYLRASPEPMPSPGEAAPRRVLYAGTWYPQGQDPDPMLGALRVLADRGEPVTLTVAGPDPARWRQAAEARGLGGLIEALGWTPLQRTLELMRTCGALWVMGWEDADAGVIPAKLPEYLAAGRPVVLTGPRGEAASLAERTGRGVWLGDRPESVAEALGRVLEGQEPGPGDAELDVRGLSRAVLADKMLGLIEHAARRDAPEMG